MEVLNIGGEARNEVRAIRIALADGEIATLITNVGEERIKYEAFK